MKKMSIRIIIAISIFLAILNPVKLIITEIFKKEPITFDEYLGQSKLDVVEKVDYYPIEMVGENIIGEGITEYIYDVLVASETKVITTSTKYDISRFDNPRVEIKVYSYIYEYPYPVGGMFSQSTSRTISYIEIPLLDYKENLPNHSIEDDFQKSLIKKEYEYYANKFKPTLIHEISIDLFSFLMSVMITWIFSSTIFERFSKDGKVKLDTDTEKTQEGWINGYNNYK